MPCLQQTARRTTLTPSYINDAIRATGTSWPLFYIGARVWMWMLVGIAAVAGILHETLLNQPGEFLLGPAVPSLKIEQLYMLSFFRLVPA